MRQASRAEHEEEVHLGNAEFDMLAFRRELPFLRRGNALFPKCVALGFAREQAAPVDPRAEIG